MTHSATTHSDFRNRAIWALNLLALVLAFSTVAVDVTRFGAPGHASVMAAVFIVIQVLSFWALGKTSAGRCIVVAVLMGQVAALLVAMRGSPMQIDMHMAFFAVLAITALLYDVRALLVGTALVAVHHLGLGLLWSELVFYGNGNLERITLHAIILLAESRALIWMTQNTLSALSMADERADEVSKAAALAEASANTAASISEQAQHKVQQMRRLQSEFSEVVEAGLAGNFTTRMRDQYDDPALQGLADRTNALVTSIEQTMGSAMVVLRALADADVGKRMDGKYSGVFGELQRETNELAENMSDIVIRLRDSSQVLKSATGEVLSGTNDLADRTVRQTTAIEETSATMAQLATVIAQNAQRAQDASGVSDSVTQSAEQGGEVMAEANAAMIRISESSAKISTIIGLIDDIAFQTNLLALNASVEAARAGDAGKGFAVVAVEVRRLAQSAAGASADVKMLIEQSAREVQEGSRLVADATERLTTMVGSARSSGSLMNGVAEDSREQASSIEQLKRAVQQLEEITQHNAALVDQINAAMGQMKVQAISLDSIVDVFKISRDDDTNETGAREALPHAAATMATPRIVRARSG